MDISNFTNQNQTASLLKIKLKGLESDDENHKIRLHRAISWLQCAEEQKEDPDIQFISLWIAFNACYAGENFSELSYTEKNRFQDFIHRLVHLDTESSFFDILWVKFSGPIRLLMDNKFAFKQFWQAQRDNSIDWKKAFERSKQICAYCLQDQDVSGMLTLVLDRLYTVRNQLMHGGATYKSRVNRSQVKDACQILSFLVPQIIEIMLRNLQEDWGDIRYPVISN